MTEEIYVGKKAEFEDGSRKIVEVNNREVCVILKDDEYFAYENYCYHQGGPACEGQLLAKVEAVLAEDKTLIQETYSDQEMHIVCPWHGWEYELKTGECVTNRRIRLKSYEVLLTEEDIYVKP